jgi:hypothetical protein
VAQNPAAGAGAELAAAVVELAPARPVARVQHQEIFLRPTEMPRADLQTPATPAQARPEVPVI